MSRDEQANPGRSTEPGTGASPSSPGTTGPTGLRDARTLRPGSALAVGAGGGAVGLLLLVLSLLGSPRSWPLVSGTVLALVLLWLFVVRPCAVVHADGIRFVNPLRDVDLSWSAVDEVRSRWALEIVSGGRRFTAWGVPADPGRPRYGRELLAIGGTRMSGRAAAAEPPKRPKVEAQTVAAEIEARVAEARRTRTAGPRVAAQSWDPVSVGLLLAAVAFVVVGTFVV